MGDASRPRRDPLRHRIHVRAWIERHPQKRRAHNLLRNAVRRGEVKRQPCEVCGAPAEGHHPDYSDPLRVEWVCRRHHAELHRTGPRAEAPAEPVHARDAAEHRP